MISVITLLGYVGPETVFPLTSILAAIGGVFLMGGRVLLRTARQILARLISKNPA